MALSTPNGLRKPEPLAEVDMVVGASYRQQAFEVLTNDAINPTWKERICDRLNCANQIQALATVGPDESY